MTRTPRLRLSRLVSVLVALTAARSALPAVAQGAGDDIVWGPSNYSAGVAMKISEPGAEDPHVLVQFKRVGGTGGRRVRLAERHYRAATHDLSHWRYSAPRSISVGQKLTIASKATLPCKPEVRALRVDAQLRVARPNGTWGPWETWLSETQFSRKC